MDDDSKQDVGTTSEDALNQDTGTIANDESIQYIGINDLDALVKDTSTATNNDESIKENSTKDKTIIEYSDDDIKHYGPIDRSYK